jgi:hypothetical protein
MGGEKYLKDVRQPGSGMDWYWSIVRGVAPTDGIGLALYHWLRLPSCCCVTAISSAFAASAAANRPARPTPTEVSVVPYQLNPCNHIEQNACCNNTCHGALRIDP